MAGVRQGLTKYNQRQRELSTRLRNVPVSIRSRASEGWVKNNIDEGSNG